MLQGANGMLWEKEERGREGERDTEGMGERGGKGEIEWQGQRGEERERERERKIFTRSVYFIRIYLKYCFRNL